MRISAFTQIIVTVAVTAWVFILPVKAVATILVLSWLYCCRSSATA